MSAGAVLQACLVPREGWRTYTQNALKRPGVCRVCSVRTADARRDGWIYRWRFGKGTRKRRTELACPTCLSRERLLVSGDAARPTAEAFVLGSARRPDHCQKCQAGPGALVEEPGLTRCVLCGHQHPLVGAPTARQGLYEMQSGLRRRPRDGGDG